MVALESQTFSDGRGAVHVLKNPNYLKDLPLEIITVDNLKRFTWRGFHWQVTTQQTKIIRVLKGSIIDYTLDMDPHSPDYKTVKGRAVTDERSDLLLIQPQYAHGYITQEENTVVQYLIYGEYDPGGRVTVRHDDPLISEKIRLPTGFIASESDLNVENFKWLA